MRHDLPGSAGLQLAANVVHLDPAPAVFEAMLGGWGMQQRARLLVEATVLPRLRLMRRLVEFSNLYPWQWTPAEAEAFIVHLRSGPRPLAISTARGYGLAIRLFCEYLTDARYGWLAVCSERFGTVPQQVMHEGNSVLHIEDYLHRRAETRATARRPARGRLPADLRREALRPGHRPPGADRVPGVPRRGRHPRGPVL